jgi:hypothetical protein
MAGLFFLKFLYHQLIPFLTCYEQQGETRVSSTLCLEMSSANIQVHHLQVVFPK